MRRPRNDKKTHMAVYFLMLACAKMEKKKLIKINKARPLPIQMNHETSPAV